MPKEYPAETGSQKTGAAGQGPGRHGRVKKTFGVYDKPVRTSPAMMIGIVVIVAVIILLAVLMMMHR
jgi:hypothetical protein